MLFSVGVNVNQYACFLSINAIRDLFDGINEAMLSNFFHSFSNRPFQDALSKKTGISKAKREIILFLWTISFLVERVDVVWFLILLKFASLWLMEGVWITWNTWQGRNMLALYTIIFIYFYLWSWASGMMSWRQQTRSIVLAIFAAISTIKKWSLQEHLTAKVFWRKCCSNLDQ